MECFLVFYAKSTGTQLAARHQNVPFQGSIFVMLAVPSQKPMECFRPVRAGKYSWRSPVFLSPSDRAHHNYHIARRHAPEVEPIFGPLFTAPSRESEPTLKTEFSGFSRVDEKKNHEEPA
jgi:hypothetical protein